MEDQVEDYRRRPKWRTSWRSISRRLGGGPGGRLTVENQMEVYKWRTRWRFIGGGLNVGPAGVL